MRKLVDQGFKAVAAGATADKDRLAVLQYHSADAPAEDLLDDGFANHKDLPVMGHRIRPDARPGFAREISDVLAPDRSMRAIQNQWFEPPPTRRKSQRRTRSWLAASSAAVPRTLILVFKVL